MEWVHLTMRAVHVLLGSFWVGTVLFAVLYLDPAIREAGPDGGRVMGILLRRGYLRTILLVGAVVVLSGIYLLWAISGGFAEAFMGSRSGVLLSIGGLAGVLALLVGAHVSLPTARKLGEVARHAAESEGSPSQEDQDEMARLRRRLTRALRGAGLLLLVAILTMALGPHV
jgi:uncharacterized membrane protein